MLSTIEEVSEKILDCVLTKLLVLVGPQAARSIANKINIPFVFMYLTLIAVMDKNFRI